VCSSDLSNRRGNARALVVYHNRFASTQGWIRTSVGYAEKHDGESTIVSDDLVSGLGLDDGDAIYYRFRDHVSGLEYLRKGEELASNGFYVELDAYACHVFLDWRRVHDVDGRYRRLHDHLGGRPVESLDQTWRFLEYGGIYDSIRAILEAETPAGQKAAFRHFANEVEERVDDLDVEDAYALFDEAMHRIDEDTEFVAHDLVVMRQAFMALGDDGRRAREFFDEWAVSSGLADRLGSYGGDVFKAVLDVAELGKERAADAREWFKSTDVRDALGVHEFEGTRWFNKEKFEAFVEDFPLAHAADKSRELAKQIREEVRKLEEYASESGFDFDALVRKVRGEDDEDARSASPEDQEE